MAEKICAVSRLYPHLLQCSPIRRSPHFSLTVHCLAGRKDAILENVRFDEDSETPISISSSRAPAQVMVKWSPFLSSVTKKTPEGNVYVLTLLFSISIYENNVDR